MTSIFSGLITSKTCIRILMRLFFNPKQNVYLRELADEFGMSTSMAREEQQLSKAGLYSQAKKTAKKSTIRPTSSTPFFQNSNQWSAKPLAWTRYWKASLKG